MSRAIDVEKAIEIIETKQKELCPVGRYGRNYVYGSDREKYDAWDEIIDVLENLPTLTPPNEWVSVEERLPEVGQEVLVYWRNTSQKAEHFELTHYDGDHWFLLDNTERPWIVVVAWMPLPAPPAKEDQK